MLTGGQPRQPSVRPSGLLARGQNSFCQSPVSLYSTQVWPLRGGLSSHRPPIQGRPQLLPLFSAMASASAQTLPPVLHLRPGTFSFFALFCLPFFLDVFLKARCFVRKAMLEKYLSIFSQSMTPPVSGNQSAGIVGDSAG